MYVTWHGGFAVSDQGKQGVASPLSGRGVGRELKPRSPGPLLTNCEAGLPAKQWHSPTEGHMCIDTVHEGHMHIANPSSCGPCASCSANEHVTCALHIGSLRRLMSSVPSTPAAHRKPFFVWPVPCTATWHCTQHSCGWTAQPCPLVSCKPSVVQHYMLQHQGHKYSGLVFGGSGGQCSGCGAVFGCSTDRRYELQGLR